LPRSPFWLSHHEPADYGRCVRAFGLHVCARCLGVYPVLFAALGLQIAYRAPLGEPYDLWVALALALPVPAVVDWARGRWRPKSGTNALRLFTGGLLGAALARSLYLHLRRPGHPLAMAQLLGLLAIAAAVEGVRLWQRHRPEPSKGSSVQSSERSNREP
jgi:uncharacterized membrane protein